MTEKKYYFWLQSLFSFSYEERYHMVSCAGSLEELFTLSAADLFRFGLTPTFTKQEEYERFRNEEKIDRALSEAEEKGLHFVSCTEEIYPKKLLNIPDHPFGLFYKGGLPENDRPSLAIVGSRRCSEYGKEMAFFFGRELASHGINIISGMALGVDGYSQRGALASGGKSYAVLAGGADLCYPRENIDLYEKLKKGGGILSERLPGTSAFPKDFPIRNRIISGLSDVLIVIEAAENSGSLITVNQALCQNCEVFALPGRVGERMAKGCNELLKNGAQVLTCPEDVLQYLGMRVEKETEKKKSVTLTKEEQTVFQHVSRSPVSTEELLKKTSLPVSALSEILVRLEIKGLIKRSGLGGYTET